MAPGLLLGSSALRPSTVLGQQVIGDINTGCGVGVRGSEQVGGRDVFLISISVDPEHDTPAVLKEYAERLHAGPGWTFLTGKAADIELIQRRLGAYPTDGTPHTGMAIYGNEASGSWSATPIIQNAAGMARIVLRLVESPTAISGAPKSN